MKLARKRWLEIFPYLTESIYLLLKTFHYGHKKSFIFLWSEIPSYVIHFFKICLVSVTCSIYANFGVFFCCSDVSVSGISYLYQSKLNNISTEYSSIHLNTRIRRKKKRWHTRISGIIIWRFWHDSRITTWPKQQK